MKRLNKHQTGDTIVEVLVAITVIGAVLAGAYVASNYNLKQTRSAEERTTALKYAESQLEQINAAASNGDTSVFTTNSFHMQNGTCGANPCNNGKVVINNGLPYTVVVNPTPIGASNQYQYIVIVNWVSATGSGQDQVSLAYKVDKLP